MRWLVVLLLVANVAPARAGDRIDELTTQLSSSSEKTRLTAVVSLARLDDKRALKPLVTALHDPSAPVRALAASALGHLGHKASLPSLRNAATDDTDETVREKAREAAVRVAKVNNLPDELPPTPKEAQVQARRTSGFGRSPHAVEDRPDLYVVIKSSNDDSPGSKGDKVVRKANGEVLKTALENELKAAPQVTMTDTEAKRWGLEARHIDVSVVKLDVDTSGSYVEISADLRLAISDDTGKMLSFLSGGAKVQVPRSKYKPQFLPDFRKEALEGAMKGMFDKLLAHLRETSQS
jgi:hypothetical protein